MMQIKVVWLQITGTSSGSITVSAPINANIAPPGYYMIHVLNSSGVPSIAKIIAIPGTAQPPDTTPPSQVTGLSATDSKSVPRLIYLGLQTHQQMELLITMSIEVQHWDFL